MALTANQDWLYKQMSGMNVDLGSEEQFAQAMQDESNLQWVYEQASKMGIDLGTPEQFASAMQMPVEERETKEFGNVQSPTLHIPTMGNDATQMPQIGQRVQIEESLLPINDARRETEKAIEARMPMFDAYWNGTPDRPGDSARLEKIMQEASTKADAAANAVLESRPASTGLPSVMGGGFGNIGYSLMASKEANKHTSPDVIIDAFTRSLDEDWINAVEALEQKAPDDYTAVTRPMSDKELLDMYQRAGVMSPEDYDLYRKYVMGKLQERFASMNVPQSKMEYFVNKFMQSNLIAQLASAYTDTPTQRAMKMQGVEQYERDNDNFGTKAIGFGADVAGLLADPSMLIMPMVGSAAGNAAVRGVAGYTLGKMGYASAQEVAARAMLQRGILQTAGRLAGSAFTFAGIDATHDIVNQLYAPRYNERTGQYEQADWNAWQTTKAAARGAITGTLFGGAGLLGDKVQHVIGDSWGKTAGLIAGKSTHFVGGTNAMVATSVVSQLLQGKNLSDINWGEEYAHSAAMQLVFDIQGGVRNLGQIYSGASAQGKKISLPQAFKANWQRMKQDPYAGSFTKEEIEQFNNAGIKGKDAYEILLNLNGGKEYKSLNELYEALERVAEDPTIDTQAKYRLASLIYGKINANVRPVDVDAYQDEQGRYVVRTYDNAGQTYETRTFDSEDRAQAYRQQQYDDTRANLKAWQEGVISNYYFAQEMQRVADEAIVEIQQRYPQYSKEQIYAVMRETMLNPHTNRPNAIAENAEADAIRGMFEDYLVQHKPQVFDALSAIRKMTADRFGIGVDEVRNVIGKDYHDLDMRERGIYDDYVSRLRDVMPKPEKSAQRSQQTTNQQSLPQGGDGTPVTQEPEQPISPAAAEHQRAVDEVTQSVRERTHGNGYIYPVAMPGNAEKTGFVVGEVVPVIDESNPEQLRIENDDIVTVKWSDGTVTQERAMDLDLTGAPMMAQQAVDIEVENHMYAYTQQRIQNGEQPVMMRNGEGILEGFFPTEGGLLEDQNGVQYTLEQLAEQGWQETKPVLFVNDTQQIAALDNGDGTYTQVDALGNPIAEPMNAEAFREQGFAMVPLEEEQPKSQAPVEAPVVQQAPVETQAPEVQESAAPVVPNIETMSADELGGSAVEYMGDRASAMAYLEAERDKADAEVQRTSKLKVTRFNGPEDFKRQNDQIQAAKRAAIDRYNKLQNAITAANAYKTLAEQKEEAERKEREAALREQRRQLAEAEAAGDIEAKWQNTKKTVGFTATKTLPNGQKVNGHYILTEAGDVVPSHDPRKNYADSEGYVMENGQNVNDNNYKDPEVQKIANDIAQNYGGQAVEQMPFLENKAGRVLSGNNRTISGIIAAENNTDQAYLAALAENAQQYGFTPEQLAEYQHPRLQFVVEDELPFTTGTFAMFNQQEKKTKSSVNRAIANSKMVTEAVRDKMLEVMDQYDSLDSFFGSENAAADIVQSLISEGLMTQQEVAGLTESTGTGFKFSQSGREYVTDMLLGTLFDEQTIRMLAGEKTLKQAILRALPSIVENRRLKGYELTESINKAVQILYEARKANEGKSTEDAFQLFLRQVDAFEGKVTDRFDGFDIILANRMSAGVEQLREMLNLYNNSARDEANGQMGFFEPRSSEDIKQDVYEYYTKQQPDLAAALNGAAEEGTQSQSPVSSGVTNEGDARQEVENKIVPDRPNSKQLQGMNYTVAEAEDYIGRIVRNILDENGYEDVEIVGTKVIGSRVNGDAREDSDLDAIVEFKGDAREDSLFNLLHEQPIEIDGVTVDINPITEGKSGTIEQFMRRADEYLAEKEAAKAKQAQEDAERQKLIDAIGQYLGSISSDGFQGVLFDNQSLIPLLKRLRIPQKIVDAIQEQVDKGAGIDGFYLLDHIFMNVDALPNPEHARSRYVHERQHGLTERDPRWLNEVVKVAEDEELKDILQAMSNSNFYDPQAFEKKADEFISYAMEVAYSVSNDEELETVLKEYGVKEELINIIKSINNEQRESESLNRARRVPYVDVRREDNSGQGGRDSEPRQAGNVGQQGSGSSDQSPRGVEGGGDGVPAAGEVTPGEKTPKPIGKSTPNPQGQAPQTPIGSEKAAEIKKAIADFKKQYPDPNVAIFFRNGKTYDIYGEDAVKAAEILGIEPTEKDGMPFVSFPTEDVGTNLRKFIANGVKVGIANHPAHKPSKGDYQQGDKFMWEGKEAIIKGFTHFGTAIVEVDGSRRELSREQLDDILDYGDYMYHVGDVVTYNGKRAQIVEFASGEPVIEVEGESERRYVSFSDIERVKKETPTEDNAHLSDNKSAFVAPQMPIDTQTNAQKQSKAPTEDPRFSVSGTQVIPVGEKTLVGLHNISAEKLRKAIKMGGLANPSTAVINIASQNHEQYGDISLIMPSSLVDSKTGRNAGTFTGDIWSPTYPSVERIMSDKGDEAYYQAITKAFGDNEARRPILSRAKLDFDDYLDSGNVRAGLAYWYLLEKGIEPGDVYFNSGISDDIKERFRPLYDKGILDLTKEDYRTLLSLIAEQQGKTAEDMLQDAQESKARYQQTIDDPEAKQFYKKIAQQAIDEIDLYGVRYNVLSNGYHAMERAIRDDGKIDLDSTLIAAQDIVQTQHQADFDKWLSDMDERFDISEVLFQDYDRDGNRIYKPHTLANVSRMMNKEDLQNAGDHGGLGATRGILVKRLETLADIRAEKGRLRPGTEEDIETEEWNKMQDEWFNKVLNPLSDMQKISDNPFSNVGYAETRLQEALRTKDPIAHLNKEYGYHIAKDSQWAKDLADMVERVKNLPTKYFETKFRRPVYLNEFANAVVPNDLPQDLRAGLESAGLRLFSYDPNTQGSRRDATLEATAGEGIRFSINGRGASTGSSKRSNRDIEALRQFESVRPEIAKEMESIKNNALNDGTFMKAPNGKPTNLDERQWLQVRTRAFKRWFGDWENDPENASKVVDANGEPMVAKHGTPFTFTTFDKSKQQQNDAGWLGRGFYFFTKNDDYAAGYARGGQVINAFLNIREPYYATYADMERLAEMDSKEESERFTKGLIDEGYDGVYFDANLNGEWVAFNPNQIKSATNNNGDFSEENDDIRFSISNQNNDIFYSNAERAVEGIKQEKATPEQWRAMIEKAGGLKAGEDKWIGLSDWLAQQRPTVTPQANETRSQFVERAAAENKRFTLSKQDLLDYIREHKIQIEEVEYDENEYDVLYLNRKKEFKRYYDEAVDAGEEEPQDVAWQRMIDEYGDDFELAYWVQGDELMRDNDSDYAQWEDDAEGYPRNINETRLAYTTEGLENKREIALTVPTIESWNESDEIHFGDAGEGRAIAWVRFGDAYAKGDATIEQQKLFKELSKKYNCPPYALRENASKEDIERLDAVEAKINEEYKINGYGKVLVIDEIQSKRHQEGREKGYYDGASSKELMRQMESAEKAYTDYLEGLREKYGVDRKPELFGKLTEEEAAEADRLNEEANNARRAWFASSKDAVPVAPFEKNWHELAMKRILRFAAENGYDKVAWTTGEQQAKRYDIGKEIDHIVKTDENTYEVYPTSGLMMTLEFDENGMYADEYDREYNGKSMSDIFGKDLAKRLKEMPVDETLQGDGLRVGYDGMKGFYDDILPRFMQKYGKKWGVQVGEVTMPQLEEGYQTMHAIDINDAMRESVLEGQPMFSISGRGVNGTMKPQEGETRSRYIARVAETVKNMTPRNTTIDDAIRFSITVNHNSPYLLKRADGAFVDPETGERLGFDHRFMGAGEGNQAHGWGSYFSVNDLRGYAENHLVMGGSEEAKEEEERIYSAFDIPGLNKTPYFGIFDDPRSTIFRIVSAVNENKQRPQSLKLWLEDKLKESKEIISSIPTYRQASGEDWYKKREAEFDEMFIPVLLKYMKHDLDMRNRHHYSVDIPDNTGENYLEEGKAPKRALRKMLKAMTDEQKERIASIPVAKYTTGEEIFPKSDLESRILWLINQTGWRDLYEVAEIATGSKQAASELLSKAGFVGIHYDGRRDGECYVIFNPDDAVITDHIRFSVTGSRGAANIDKMEGVTTRMDNLAAARQMEEDGKDAKTIRMATGWERGADGKWRYEIDDVQLNTGNVKANFRKLDRRGVTAPMVWYHNKFTDIIADSPERKQLLAAYPQLADLDIEFYDYPNKERGAYSSEKKKISINRANVRSVDECRSVLLHEIQHAIQEAELFAKGTSKEQIQLTWKLNNEVHNKVDEYFDKMGFKEWLTSHNGDKAFVDRLMQVIHMFPNRDFNIHYLFVETLPRDKQIDAIDVLGDANDVIQSNRDAIYGADRKGMTMKPDELYYNTAGEVESRNVQNRMNLTPEERRERLLEETEDVAREDQVVIMNAFDMANDEVPQTTNRATSNYQSRNSIVTEALVKQANESFRLMQSALRKVSADLRTINAIRTQQFEYDRKVVDMLLDLYNSLLQENSVWAGYMPDTTRRIATQIVHAIGKKDISAEVNTIMDHMVHAQAKAAQRQWDKLRTTPVDKINISGVVMQGKVALQGQHALKALNEALNPENGITLLTLRGDHTDPNKEVDGLIDQLMQMEDNATDESLKLQYKGQWIGYEIAAQYLERIQHIQEERKQLDIELQAARSNRAIKPSARQQLVANIQQAMRDNYIAQADAYAQSAKDLAEYVTTQEEQAKDFIHRQDANRDKIRSYAQRDLEGLATNPNRNRTRGNIVRQIWDAFASPIRDLQSLLRLTGLHAPDGEGYLYNHFMRGWMDGADKERLGIVNASKTLDAKISELTHGKYKTWEEAARKINDASHNMFTITMLNGVDGKDMPVTEEIPLNAGNALYIYAVNKMNDGRMKLNGMNITEEDVQALADKVREQFGQEILDVVDWVQSEFFSQLRNRYNPTHEALFGAPMDAVENYFPLRINANARQQNEDLSEPDTDAARLLAGTSTGAIKRRTRNSLPLDVRNADFFQEVIRHISQMERWNAFAQWNRDANILFSDINFRNRIKGMKGTIYGEGDKLYNYMKDAFRVAIGTYKPNADGFSKEILNAAKGVTSAKINFRVFTALKQIASFPAFFTYMQDGTFVTSYLRNWLTPHSTMKWAKENLPNFEKRVSKRDLGDMRLMQRSTDWQWNKRILELSSKYGMFFNVLFDTLTCATGARAVYDSHLADYMKKGYSEEDARNRARQDAEQAFNTSQQSSEGAFMSAVQQDRNLVTAALTVFRTSPIQYTRNFMYHTRNLLRKFGEGKRDEQIAFRMGQYKNDGLNDEQARKAAEKDYNKSLRQDIVGFVVYGALLNILWRLAGQIPYLLLGDDDDKKKQILDDATSGGAWFSPFTGLLGGGIVESALDGNGSVADMFAPEMPFTQDIKRAGQYLSNDKYAEFASQALSVLMQSGTGFDPLTASDMVSRIVTTLDSEEELEAATQALRVSQALLSIPQSQYEQMLIDKVVSGETDEDAALEDYIRYQKVHTAPLTWWLRGEESDEKAEENAEERFYKLLTERDKLHNPEDYEE